MSILKFLRIFFSHNYYSFETELVHNDIKIFLFGITKKKKLKKNQIIETNIVENSYIYIYIYCE